MKHLLLLFSCFFLVVAFSQVPKFNVGGKALNFSSGKGESVVTVEIVQSGATLASTSTGNDGSYDIKAQVDYSKVFFVVFKKSGYFTKKIEMDFTQLDIELVPAGEDVLPFQKNHTIDMIPTMPNLDLTFLETEPVGIILYDPQLGEPENDNSYYNKIKKKIDNLIKVAEEKNKGNDAAFQALFKEAENLYLTQKKYEDALVKYEQALELKPSDELTLNRIDELDAIIQKLKEDQLASQQADAAYIALKNEADVLRDKGSFQQAIEKYNQALELKDELYPRDQIEYCEEQIENAAKYESLIAAADQFFNQKSYKTALTKYQEAQKLKPNESHPKERIAACNGFIDGQAAALEKKKKYEEIVVAADALYEASNWKDAKAKYAEAYAFDDNSDYPIERIKLCDIELQKIAEEEARKKKVEELLAAGLSYFNQSKWLDAKLKYEEVLIEEKTNDVAQQKLIEIENKINEEKANQSLLENFARLEKEGDAADLAAEFSLAKSKYEEALKIKLDQNVNEKLQAVDAKIAEKAAQEKRIQDLLTQADNLYKASNWLESKLKYQAVLNEDDKNELAKAKILELDEKIKEDAAQQDANNRFNTLVSEGDKATLSLDYLTAETKYSEALNIKVDQAIKDKLSLVQQKILDQNAQDALNKEFNELKLQAEQKEGKKDWLGAQKLYEEALLKKNDATVSAKIEELKNKIKQEEDAAALDANFEALKKEGFELADNKKWVEAKSKLEEAKKLKVDPFVVSKLALIDQEIAKSNSQLENENNFNKLSNEGLAYEQNKDYKNAIDSYTKALNYKPNDSQTKAKIEQLSFEQENLQKQLAADKSYQDFLAQGKSLMTEKKYAEAIQKFNEANLLKPTEKEPVDLAAEAEKLEKAANSDADIQFNNIIQAVENKILSRDFAQARDYASRAQKLRPNDKRVIDLLSQIEVQEKLEKSYSEKMVEAENAVIDKKYDEAIKLFQAAKELKYDEITPQNRIDAVSKLKADQANQNEIDMQYNAFIKSGFSKFSTADYNGALSDYLSALNLKNNDKTAQDKISEIEQILDDLNKNIAEQNALKKQIDQLKNEADTYFKLEDYANAIVKYNEILKLEESAATRLQIAEATRLKNEKEAQNVTSSLYNNYIKNGDDNLALKDYNKAKESYLNALKLMPNETYPKAKIKAIEELQSANLVGNKLPDLGEPYYNSAMDGYALVAKNEVATNANLNEINELKHFSDIQEKENKALNNSIVIDNAQLFVNAEKLSNNEGTVNAVQNRSVLLLAEVENEINQYSLSNGNDIWNSSMDKVNQLYAVDTEYKKLTILNETYTNDNAIKVQSIEEDAAISRARQLRNASEKSIDNTLTFEKVDDDNLQNSKKNDDVLDENVKNISAIVHHSHTSDISNFIENSGIVLNAQKSFENIDNTSSNAHIEVLQNQSDNTAKMSDIAQKDALNTKEINSFQQLEQFNNMNSYVEINSAVKTEEYEISDAQMVSSLEIKDIHALSDRMYKESQLNNSVEIINQTTTLVNIEKQNKVNVNENSNENILIAERIIGLSDAIEEANGEEDELNKQRQTASISKLNQTEKQILANEKDKVAEGESNVATLSALNNSIRVSEKNNEESNSIRAIQNIKVIENMGLPKPNDADINAPNELGQAYPEGISEEYFTKKNSHGDVTTFITRRIVVINGHGDVFVKTRSNSLTTYTKNGLAISEMSYEEQSNVDGLPKFIKTE
jgi:tetratricopeptide (TPR) repeat protein